MLRNPPAHRPSAQVHLLEPQRIQKAHHDLGLVMHGIGEIGRLFTAPIADQIGRVDTETGLHEIGRQVLPVLALPAEPMHQHHHWPAGWSPGKIMHAMARNLNASL